MSARFVHQSSGTADMQNYGAHAGIKVDTDDDKLKFKDNDGNVREVPYEGGPEPVAEYAADGAISITSGVAILSKAGVGAYTLAAPTAAQEGTILVITSETANAHVVTATGLLQDGVVGGGKNTATFAAFVGASITLVAVNLLWNVVSANNVTVA